MKYTPAKNESGMALIFAIGLLALLLLIGLAFVGNAVNYRKVAENNSARSQSRMFALSAVGRAASSLMVYTHQYTRENDAKEPPRNLDHIYSFAQYDSDGSVKKGGSYEFTDLLLGDKSLMALPENYSVINLTDVLSFNARYQNSSWSGNWVFFTNGQGGSDRRLIGRAAWQVIGLSASIAAPVFMRGHLDDLDEYNDDFMLNDNRWGREIDEVFLNDGIFSGVKSQVASSGANAISSYDELYKVIGAEGTSDEDKKRQRWVETWFLPELHGQSVAEASAVPGKYEAYVDDCELIPRFNISELFDGVKWDDSYTGFDQWYARLDIENADDANSSQAIATLTQDSEEDTRCGNVDYDSEYDGEFSAIPFLRRIGNGQGTFAELAMLRKQIAANFNDYCDNDGIPTSDIAADKWLDQIGKDNSETDGAGAVTVNHPTFTGNEKTPYLYELGMNFGLVSDDAQPQVTARKSEDGKFLIGMNVKAAPIVKLCNIYNFDPEEKKPMSNDRLYKEFGTDDFLRAYVDFGNFSLGFRLREAKLKDLEFSYLVTTTIVTETTTTDANGNPTTNTETETLPPETKTFKYSEVGLTALDDSANGPNLIDKLFTFSGKDWKRAGAADVDGSTKIKPAVFSAADVKNTDGSKPYPYKKSGAATDDMWQIVANDTADDLAFDFSLDSKGSELFDGITVGAAAVDKKGIVFEESKKSGTGSLDEYKKAFGNVSEETVETPSSTKKITTTTVFSDPKLISPELTSIDIVKIKVEHFDTALRRAVLTVNDGTVDKEIGVDYVRQLDAHNYIDKDIELELYPASGVIPGFVLGSYRNYDPRQNLNSGDWLKVGAFAKVDNFITPANDISGLDESNASVALLCLNDGINKAKLPSDTAENEKFVPFPDSAPLDRDEEETAEPAFKGVDKDLHISTAVIRNAPMMSPWEIGFIHRGKLWQTINLKGVTTGTNSEFLGLHSAADAWGDSGTAYQDGDGAILEQIKMTDRVKSYGKINVNRLREADASFNDHAAANKKIIQALFENIVYNEEPLDFVKSSQRDADGKFPAPQTGTAISQSEAETIVTNFLAGNRPQYGRRINFINWSHNDYCLENAFSATVSTTQTTDAAQEEIIGKTINLLSAEYSYPNIVDVIVVAQSIRDMGGEQVKLSVENDSTKFQSAKFDAADFTDLADTGVISMPCEFGRFDMLEHNDDPDKNVYFDEITGEVKMFVRLSYDASTGKMTILKIDYL